MTTLKNRFVARLLLAVLALVVAGEWRAAPGLAQSPDCYEDVYTTITSINPFNPLAGPVQRRVLTGRRFRDSCYTVNDSRVNQDNAAPMAIYCQPDGIAFWNIDLTSRGTPAFFVDRSLLDAIPETLDSNLLLVAHRGYRLYALTSGELQLNGPPDWEGKEYVFIWQGCPPAPETAG